MLALSVAVRITAFHQFGAKGRALPAIFGPPTHFFIYGSKSPPALTALLSSLLYSSPILLYLLHPLLVSTVTVHLQNPFTTTLRLLPIYHFQDGSIVSKCRPVGSIENSQPVDQSSVSLVWESIVT